jgi:PadR family transcriptional regulator, regulatory protein PadR
MTKPEKELQRLLSGFIRMHVLHHAAEGNLCGHWMIEELRHHGYNISPGTLYPMLKSMQKNGWLSSRAENSGSRRTLYQITAKGRKALKEVRSKLGELFREVGAKHS